MTSRNAMICTAALPAGVQLDIANTGTDTAIAHLARNPHLTYEAWQALLRQRLTGDTPAWLAAAPHTAEHLEEFYAHEQRTAPRLIAVELHGPSPALEAQLLTTKMTSTLAETVLSHPETSEALRAHAAAYATPATQYGWAGQHGGADHTLTYTGTGVVDGLTGAGVAGFLSYAERHPHIVEHFFVAHRGRPNWKLNFLTFLSELPTGATQKLIDVLWDPSELPSPHLQLRALTESASLTCSDFDTLSAMSALDPYAMVDTSFDDVDDIIDHYAKCTEAIAEVIAERNDLGCQGITGTLATIDPAEIAGVLRWLNRPRPALPSLYAATTTAWALRRLALNPRLAPGHADAYEVAAADADLHLDEAAVGDLEVAAQRIGATIDVSPADLEVPGNEAVVRRTWRRYAAQFDHALARRHIPIAEQPLRYIRAPETRIAVTDWFTAQIGTDAGAWGLLLDLVADLDFAARTCGEAAEHINRLTR